MRHCFTRPGTLPSVFRVTETEACIALNMVPGMGPVRLRHLLDTFETPQRVLAAGRSALKAVHGIGAETADALASWESHVDLSSELKRIEDFGARTISWNSPEYPAALRTIHNPPIVLYVWGDLRPEDNLSVSIVGSRSTTHYGIETAKKLAYQLAYAGYAVISGLARGIDSAAHQGALAAKGRTIAVIGSGLMNLYPPENKALAEKIAASGAVISEYPMERQADRQTFPYRNRIVAGWSRGLLVVEAGLNSGALITADQALEQGRTVFAVPGPIDRPTSAGSNRLIQQGARLVTSADDILDELNSLFPTHSAARRKSEKHADSPETPPPHVKLSQEETLLIGALEVGEMSLDELVAATRMPAYKVSSTLLMLEMKRLAKPIAGQRYVKA